MCGTVVHDSTILRLIDLRRVLIFCFVTGPHCEKSMLAGAGFGTWSTAAGAGEPVVERGSSAERWIFCT
jgi:hypothetical protein